MSVLTSFLTIVRFKSEFVLGLKSKFRFFFLSQFKVRIQNEFYRTLFFMTDFLS